MRFPSFPPLREARRKARFNMAKRALQLTFLGELIKQPIMYLAARKYDLVLNIRRAKITDTLGEATIELEGREENIEKAVREMEKEGVKVQSIAGGTVV